MAESIAGDREEVGVQNVQAVDALRVGARFIAPFRRKTKIIQPQRKEHKEYLDRFERGRGALFVIFELLVVNPFLRRHQFRIDRILRQDFGAIGGDAE